MEESSKMMNFCCNISCFFHFTFLSEMKLMRIREYFGIY